MAAPACSEGEGRREANKAQNRAEILEAARAVFAELGYDAATVRDIVRRTRLASGPFYNYFPDKESVFRALMREGEERRLEWLRRARIDAESYEQYLAGSFRAYFEFVASDRATFELLRRNAATLRALADDPAVTGEHRRLQMALEAAMERGDLPRMDAQYLASAMLGVAFEIAVIMVERAPVDVEGATEFATNLFLGGLQRAGRGS